MVLRTWIVTLLALLLLAGATTAGATSYIKLSPEQVRQQAQMLAVGRVTGALPAQKAGEHGIVNGMVVQVETYLGQTAGPAQLTLELFGGTVCNALNQCTSIAGGMEGQRYIGQRLLVAVEPNPQRQTLRPVGGPNGVIRLTESGWGVVDPMLSLAEKVEWETYLGQAPKLAPVAGAAAPQPAAAAPAEVGARPWRAWLPPGAVALLALAAGLWHWRRRSRPA